MVYDTSWSLDPYDGVNHALVWAVNATTGARIWSVDQGTYDPCFGPLAVNNVVYETAGYAYALDASTGPTNWVSSVVSYQSNPPALTDGVLYVQYSGPLMAFNSDTGALLWTESFDGPNPAQTASQATPVVGP